MHFRVSFKLLRDVLKPLLLIFIFIYCTRYILASSKMLCSNEFKRVAKTTNGEIINRRLSWIRG